MVDTRFKKFYDHGENNFNIFYKTKDLISCDDFFQLKLWATLFWQIAHVFILEINQDNYQNETRIRVLLHTYCMW